VKRARIRGTARASAAFAAITALAVGCGGSQASGAPASNASTLAAGACPAGALCFNVVPGGPGQLPATRLLLFWTSPNEGASPEIVTLANLSGGERSIILPFSSIAPPQHVTEVGQVWGYVLALPASEPEPRPKQAVGVPNMMLVHVQNASLAAPRLRDRFPAGVAEGTAPYVMQRGGGMFDHFLLAPPGTVFDLVVCPLNTTCDLSFPNPS
jgi:hypothetical protein